jgi:xanthine dehydrogenase iron-sulfur cluster and FAD-binding subunit A
VKPQPSPCQAVDWRREPADHSDRAISWPRAAGDKRGAKHADATTVGNERATSVGHAVALPEQYGPDARLVAGGHSLLPMVELRLARPDYLIDINDVAADLSDVRVVDDVLCIGAMTRHAELLASADAGEHFRTAVRRYSPR